MQSPLIAFSPSSLNFGLLGIGEFATRTLHISNGGSAPLAVTVPASTGAVFSWDALQTTLGANGGVSLKVEFSPLAAGAAHGALRVTSNAQGSPHTIRLSGSGRDEIPN